MLRISGKSRRFGLARRAALRYLPTLGLVSFLLASCATIPPPGPPSGWLSVLPPLSSDSLYASADVASSWNLFKVLAEATGNDTGTLERIMGKLNRVHACVRLSPDRSPEQGPELALIALGRFSTGPVARRLNGDPAWERIELEALPGGDSSSSLWPYRTFWRSPEAQIAVPQRGVLFVSAGVPAVRPADGHAAGADSYGVEALLRRFRRPEARALPSQVQAESESADLFFYIPDPAYLALARRASPTASAEARSRAQDPGTLLQNLPIRQGWISARRQDRGQIPGQETESGDRRGYDLQAVFLLDRVKNPRSVELLLRLMLTLWLRKIQADDPVEILKAATISADAESARIDSLFLEDEQIVLFLQTLLPTTLLPATMLPEMPGG
jgi:hypothetical protein